MSTSSTNGNVQMAARVSDHEKRIKTLERRSSRFSNAQCIIYRSTNQSIASGSGVAISFDTAEYDPLGMWSVIGTPTVIPLPVGGVWSVHGCVRFASTAAATGVRQVAITAGANMVDVTRVPSIAGEAVIIGSSAIRYFAAGTSIGLQVRHTFGANLDVEFASPYSAYLQLALLS